MIRTVETILQILPAAAIERLRALCDGAPIVFFDLEATGTDRQRDRIVEIGALRISGDGAIETYERRLDPGVKIPREAAAIHGITDDHVRGLPTFADVAAEVLAFFEGADLAGYNVRAFDVPLLLREFERAKLSFPLKGRRIVDAQTIFFKKEPRDLGAAVRFFSGRDHTRAHNALADVVAAAEVLAGQMERYADLPKALVALAEFSTPAEGRFVDPDKRFFWRDGEAVFNFGDMRGTPLAEVAQSNPGYLEWMLRRDFPEEAKQIARDALRGVFPSRDAKA